MKAPGNLSTSKERSGGIFFQLTSYTTQADNCQATICWGVLSSWVSEGKDVGSIFGMLSAIELAAVPRVDEELDGGAYGMQRPGEAARASPQPRQVVAQLRVVRFHRVGLALVGQRLMVTGIIHQVGVARHLVRVVLARGGCGVEHRLQALQLEVIGDLIGDDAARGAVHLGDEVDARFLEPSKV